MEELKDVIEMDENEVNEEACVTKEGLGSKIKAGLKKHGKKIVAGAAVLTCGIIGYALGKKSNEGYYDSEELDIIDLTPDEDFKEVETE